MSVDFTELAAGFDLLIEVERDLGPGKKSGRWVMFHCPFPGHSNGDRTPSLAVTPDNGRYYCFTCSASGDVLTWFRDYRKLPWKDIFSLSPGSVSSTAGAVRLVKSNLQADPKIPPPSAWQARGFDFLSSCEDNLWGKQGDKILAWLREKRGLTDETIRHYRLGYCPTSFSEVRSKWGLIDTADTHQVWLPSGVTIPCIISGVLWYINIRRVSGTPKYYKVPGSKSALFGADNLLYSRTALLCEGEFDCILADQVLTDLVGVATLGGNATRLDITTWGIFLMPMSMIFVVYDVDGKSENGLTALVGKSAQFRPIRIPVLRPGDKDISDYVVSGGDLRLWLTHHIKPFGLSGPEKTNDLDENQDEQPVSVITIYLDSLINRPWKPDDTRPCYACGTMNWLQNTDDTGVHCATCHPINEKDMLIEASTELITNG